MVRVFKLQRALNGVIVFLSIIGPRNFTRVRKNVIYTGLMSCFRVVKSDDTFLTQWTFHPLFVIAWKHRLNMLLHIC